jgi:hypothetical protein
MMALAPDTPARYQRASELLDDVLALRGTRRGSRATPAVEAALDESQEIQARLRARDDAPQARFCWHCRKPLHARSDRCPFCGEAQ